MPRELEFIARVTTWATAGSSRSFINIRLRFIQASCEIGHGSSSFEKELLVEKVQTGSPTLPFPTALQSYSPSYFSINDALRYGSSFCPDMRWNVITLTDDLTFLSTRDSCRVSRIGAGRFVRNGSISSERQSDVLHSPTSKPMR